MRRKMNDLMAKRAGMLAEAESAYKSGQNDGHRQHQQRDQLGKGPHR